jgi:hypothetical protein
MSRQTLKEIVIANIPADLHGDFRTIKEQVWFESLGREMGRDKWIAAVLHHVVDAAMLALDAPTRDEEISRAGVIHDCETELKVLWGKQTSALPDEAHATLDKDSKAAHRWKHQLLKVLKAPQTFEVSSSQVGTAGVGRSARATLMSRIMTNYASNTVGNVWTPVLESGSPGSGVAVFPCWWGEDNNGDLRVAVGWDVGDQCQPRALPLPGATCPAAFHAIGLRYELFDPQCTIHIKALRCGTPMASVLTLALTHELEAKP